MSPFRLDDPELVRREYACEERLAARISAYRWAEGPSGRDLAIEAVAEAAPRRVLEVGCGQGELAERIPREAGCKVIALDQSERMVELARARGVEAIVGDVQALPFGDGEFDCALAGWMLYHVADVDRALSELARVLRPGGRLVAATNGRGHLRELHELLGMPRAEFAFSAENGEASLERLFTRIERRDASGWTRFPSRHEAQAYVESTMLLSRAPQPLPPLEGPLPVRRVSVVFVAQKAL